MNNPSLLNAGQSANRGNKPELSLSVIVPTYRRPDEVVRCLKALETQNRRPDQVVVTVRPEDTASLESLGNFKKTTSLNLQVALVHTPGLIPAYNTGLQETWGDIVCLTDDDARPHPDWLERIVQHYSDPQVGAVGGRDMVYTGGQLEDGLVTRVGKLNWFGRRTGNHHLTLKGGQPVEVFTLKGVNSSYRRQLMGQFDANLRGLPELANEDEMGLRVRKQGYRMIYDPKILVDHFPSHKRPDARGSRAVFDRVQVYNVNHNYTYVLFKHLSPWNRFFFLLYNFLIGDSPNMALVRALYGFARTANWGYLQILPAAYAGKLAGIKTYFRQRVK
jgi:GT2 family glycosyltransferase